MQSRKTQIHLNIIVKKTDVSVDFHFVEIARFHLFALLDFTVVFCNA